MDNQDGVDKRNLLDEEVFSYPKAGLVFIAFHGKTVTTLKGKDAQRFVAKVATLDAKGAQLVMAKVTGHFKHGNER